MSMADFAAQSVLTITEGRALAESLMLDTCKVTRATGTVDELTGIPTRTQVYSGKAKRQSYEANEVAISGGGHTYVQQRYKGHFPIGAFLPKVGDVVEWTASTMDPHLAGTKDRIAALFNKSLATSMRVQLDEGVA